MQNSWVRLVYSTIHSSKVLKLGWFSSAHQPAAFLESVVVQLLSSLVQGEALTLSVVSLHQIIQLEVPLAVVQIMSLRVLVQS